MLSLQREERRRETPVGKQDVGVPRDNSLVVAVPVETKKSVDTVQTEERRRETPSRQTGCRCPCRDISLVVAVPTKRGEKKRDPSRQTGCRCP